MRKKIKDGLTNLQRYIQKNSDHFREIRKVWRRANPDKAWAHNLWARHRLTPEMVEGIYLEQIGLCPICGLSLISWDRPVIDHDHLTEKMRGLLHDKCNSKLGWYENKKNNISNYLGGK